MGFLIELQEFEKDDIVKISDGEKTTIAKVVDSNQEGVTVYREPEDITYSLEEYDIEKLGVAH